MSKSLVLTMTPQLGLTSQNPSAYYWRPFSLPNFAFVMQQLEVCLMDQGNGTGYYIKTENLKMMNAN